MTVTALDHVLVLSDDVDAARDFYCAALGLEAGERPPFDFAGHWLYAAGERPVIHLADRAEYEAHVRRRGLEWPASEHAIDHVAFAAVDLAAAAERLQRAGITARSSAVPGGSLRQLFFTAPEGLRIELNAIDQRAGAG